MTARYYKGREVLKEYKQGRLVYEKSTSIPDYLCFTALEAGQFTLTIPAAVTPTYLSYVEWSKDGRTWSHTDNTSEAVTIDVQVASGEKVYWRGSGNSMTSLNAGEPYSSKFSSTCRFDASGNITSLLLGVNYVTALVNYSTSGVRNVTFANLFRGCTTIVNAKDLILPTFTSYYTYIFYYMFYGCTSLVSSPALVSSELSTACYSGLYRECSNLAQSQVLLAPNLVGFCYRNMFQATKVNNVKCLATDISANECVTNWLLNVSSTGTFIQASGVTWPRGASGIPTGWVDIEKRTMPSGYKQVEYVSNPNYGYININRAFEANAETLEVAFVKQATGASMPFGSSIHNYRYGSVKVTEQATALAVNVGIDFANQVNKIVSIAYVTADTPRTLRYEGNASGFQLYLDGVSKSTQTCAWDAVNPFVSNMVFSASTNTSSTAYFHTKPIYYVKIWDGNGALALDYVPCIRESDNVAGFYDMAANTFRKSDNANDFTAGEEI